MLRDPYAGVCMAAGVKKWACHATFLNGDISIEGFVVQELITIPGVNDSTVRVCVFPGV